MKIDLDVECFFVDTVSASIERAWCTGEERKNRRAARLALDVTRATLLGMIRGIGTMTIEEALLYIARRDGSIQFRPHSGHDGLIVQVDLERPPVRLVKALSDEEIKLANHSPLTMKIASIADEMRAFQKRTS